MKVNMVDLDRRIMEHRLDPKQQNINILFHFAIEALQNRLIALEKGKPESAKSDDDEVAKTQAMLEKDERVRVLVKRYGLYYPSLLMVELYLLGKEDGEARMREIARNERV